MKHPIDNRYHYGIVYDLNGQIVGFNLLQDVFIGLNDEEIERVLGAYAKRKYAGGRLLSMTSELIDRLKSMAAQEGAFDDKIKSRNAKTLLEAIDTIQLLSEKLNALQMELSSQHYNDGWIPVSERVPEEREWIGTKQFGTTISDEVYVTFESPKGDRFTKHLLFQNGKLSRADQQTIDVFHEGSVPVAWMPLPEPYEPQESEEA